MAVAEAALDVFVDAQQVARLEREVAALRKQLAELRRQHQALSIRVFGGTVAAARASGAFRLPLGAKDDGKVAGLVDVRTDVQAIYEALYGEGCGTDATAEEPGGLLKRIDDLERRPTLAYRGLWQAGASYRAGDACARSGSLWVCRVGGTLERPGLDNDFVAACREAWC